jgi:Tol biopolymer transport system component
MATQKVKPGPGAMERRDRRQRRRQTYGKVGTYALVTTVVVVVAAAAFALWSSSRKPDAVTSVRPSVLVPAVSAPTGAPDTEAATPPAHEIVDYLLDLKTGETTPLPESIRGGYEQNGYAISPDGSEVAYYGRAGDRSMQVFVANLDGTGVRQITHDAGGFEWSPGSPGWSPDGTKIAYVGRHHGDRTSSVFLVDLRGGETRQVTFESEWVSGTQFSPDGSSIVYTTHPPTLRPDQVRIVSVTGGKGRRLVGHVYSASSASLSPDGSLLSYICDGDLCLANADGSDPRRIATPSSFWFLRTPSWSPDGSRLAYMNDGPYETVKVIDVTTGETMRVAHGAWPRWVDNRTLIVEVCYCPH